jgi:hypothetical protein
MPSIFEKPSILGFRQEGGPTGTPQFDLATLEAQLVKAQAQARTDKEKLDAAELKRQYDELAAIVQNQRPAETPSQTYNAAPSRATSGGPGMFLPQVSGGTTSMFPAGVPDFFENLPQTPDSGYSLAEREAAMAKLKALVQAPTASDSAPAPTYGGPMAAVPSGRQTPLPGLGGGAVPTATSEFMSRLLKLPTSADVPSIFDTMTENARQQQPGGTRAERVAAAIASGDFAEKQRQYNQEAMRMGSPTMMDAQGNIVGRELTEAERMREFFKTTGGNTMFSQTTDPAQRALQNEMMKQARAQATVNTFGTTPEERLANLQAETDARKILQSPLNSGVREVAPGVRAAFKDGQMIGFSAPGDGSPATMNDPLKRYITNPDGSVSRNYNPPQILMSDEMKDTGVRQGIEGKTGGTPMEREFIAALQAAEERKKKMASDAAAAALAATPPTTEAELIARTPAITIPPREKAAPKATPPSRLTPLKDIRGSSYVDPTTGQKMMW